MDNVKPFSQRLAENWLWENNSSCNTTLSSSKSRTADCRSFSHLLFWKYVWCHYFIHDFSSPGSINISSSSHYQRQQHCACHGDDTFVMKVRWYISLKCHIEIQYNKVNNCLVISQLSYNIGNWQWTEKWEDRINKWSFNLTDIIHSRIVVHCCCFDWLKMEESQCQV